MRLVEHIFGKECLDSGLDSPNAAFAAPIVSLTDIAIRPDCQEMIDSVA